MKINNLEAVMDDVVLATNRIFCGIHNIEFVDPEPAKKELPDNVVQLFPSFNEVSK